MSGWGGNSGKYRRRTAPAYSGKTGESAGLARPGQAPEGGYFGRFGFCLRGIASKRSGLLSLRLFIASLVTMTMPPLLTGKFDLSHSLSKPTLNPGGSTQCLSTMAFLTSQRWWKTACGKATTPSREHLEWILTCGKMTEL